MRGLPNAGQVIQAIALCGLEIFLYGELPVRPSSHNQRHLVNTVCLGIVECAQCRHKNDSSKREGATEVARRVLQGMVKFALQHPFVEEVIAVCIVQGS